MKLISLLALALSGCAVTYYPTGYPTGYTTYPRYKIVYPIYGSEYVTHHPFGYIPPPPPPFLY